MRITGSSGARSLPYDRNPTRPGVFFDSLGIAPHAQTTRATYTCPANRKASIDLLQMLTQRATVATTPGNVVCWIALPQESTLRLLMHQFGDNALYRVYQQAISQCGVIPAGSTIQYVTSDASAAGTLDYAGDIRLTEFDA